MTALRVLNYREAGAEALLQAMKRDSAVVLMGEGVDGTTGVYGHVLPAFKEFEPSRVIDTPLSENGLTGFAVGAALDGLRPVLIHQRNDFMLLAMDQIMNQAAKLEYASGGHHKIPLTILSFVARKPGEGVQHSQSLQAVFAHFPGIRVGMPATAEDVKGMILKATASDCPTIILEHRSLFDAIGTVPSEYYDTPLYASIPRPGTDITIAAFSAFVPDALKAATELFHHGISCEVIDLRWIRPLDIETVAQSVRRTRRLLALDTGWKMFGVASEIVASVCERFTHWEHPPQRMALPDVPCPASQYLERYYHPGVEEIIRLGKAIMKSI